MRYVQVLALIMVCMANGHAQQRTVWKQEPQSFFGVEFGKPLSASLPECSSKAENGKKTYDLSGSVECWYLAGNQPMLAHVTGFFGVYVETLEGNVANIDGFFKRTDFDNIERQLIAQFGEPHWRNFPLTPTKDGRQLPSKGLNWFGTNVNISCESQWVVEDEGSIGAYNKAWEREIQRTATQ